MHNFPKESTIQYVRIIELFKILYKIISILLAILLSIFLTYFMNFSSKGIPCFILNEIEYKHLNASEIGYENSPHLYLVTL